MSDHQRPERLYQVAAAVQLTTELNGCQVVGNHLTLAGLPLTQKVGVYRAANARIQDNEEDNQEEMKLCNNNVVFTGGSVSGLQL